MLARVDPHEFIMNAQASARFKSQLTAMNQGHDPGSGRGGNHTNVGDIHVNVHGGARVGHHQRDCCRPPAGYPAGDNPTREITCSFRSALSSKGQPRRWCAHGVWSTSPGPVGLVHYELLRGGRVLVPKTLAFNAVNNFAKNSFLDGWFNNGLRGNRLLHRVGRRFWLLCLQRDRRDRCPRRLG